MFDWKNARLRGFHLCSALALSLFLVLHIGNHIAGLFGAQAHIVYMDVARHIYRNPIVEPILIVLVIWQALSGLIMVIRGWKKRRGKVAWLQAISGIYLALFLLNHVAAVLAGRILQNLDTNIYFAAAGFHVPPWHLFFAPYYTLALAALGAHVGCALYWQIGPKRKPLHKIALAACLIIGATLGLLFVLSMSGQLFDLSIPAEYLRSYTSDI
jgi:hypothetical protein